MDTDPNPFRDSPDSERSVSPTEAPDDSTRDFTAHDATTSDSSSPMSDDSGEGSTASNSAPPSDTTSKPSVQPIESGAGGSATAGQTPLV